MADVAPQLMRAHPEVDFRFVVGSGFHTEALRRRMAASGIDPGRWPIEVLPFERMRAAYEDSAIVAIPTLCGEGTSLSAIEAMYFGCAVVSTWVGGLPNLIQDDRNGLLIAPDAAALGSALSRLITDEALRVRLGHTAMTDLLPRHGVARWRARVAAVLDSALHLPQEVPE
jgi:glycosyltransferase involved in cell wall biosynthesis